MAVKVVNKETGEAFSGKFAVVEKESVSLFSGCMPDKKGGLRGCGKKRVFPAATVSVTADSPAKEIKRA